MWGGSGKPCDSIFPPGNDSRYGLLSPRDTYHRLVPVNSVDTRGAVSFPEHSNLMDHDKEWASFVCFPMGGLLPIHNNFTAMFTDFNVLTSKVEKACESKPPWFEDDIVDSFGPSRPPPMVVIKLPGARGEVGRK